MPHAPQPPPFRKLRGYSFDPLLSLRMDTVDLNNVTYRVAWEKMAGPGPVGEYVEVIDFDPTVGRAGVFYTPVDLDDHYLLAQDGLDPSESNPQFHQQMVYAVTMTTIRNFEQALGRKVVWAPQRLPGSGERYVQRLRLYPHALRDANAFYSPPKKAILFGYFSSAPADESLLMPDSLVFTCLSHDIIAHEVTHAILDGMHGYYGEPTNPDVLAFHEAFADIVALFQHFTFPQVLTHQIARTRGDLASQNLLGELAQQFGTAIGGYGSLRDAIGEYDAAGVWRPREPRPDEYREVMEPHARGSILVAAVFESFLSIYKVRVADLLRLASGGSGILPRGELHPDLVNRLANEAARAARHVLTMCIRALDYCPPVDITFGDYLRAIITADVDAVPDDQHDYRLAFIDAFRRRGIYPGGVKTLSVESLQFPRVRSTASPDVPPATDEPLGIINKFLREYGYAIKYVNDRERIYDITKAFIRGATDDDQVRLAPLPLPALGLYERLNQKFGSLVDFGELTGLAFGEPFRALGIPSSARYPGQAAFQIQNLRLVNRVGSGGSTINHVVFSLVQRSGVVVDAVGNVLSHFQPGGGRDDASPTPDPEPAAHEEEDDDPTPTSPLAAPGPRRRLIFRGGCTLIFDLDTLELKYAVTKPLVDPRSWDDFATGPRIDHARVKRQFEYQYGRHADSQNAYSLYFGEKLHRLSEPFAFLHQH
jgi:hypothetical protein